MRYFVTGHTGFKGAWLTKILLSQGHDVFGYSLPAEPDSLFEKLSLATRIPGHTEGDIRSAEHLISSMINANPDVVIHLAAQPLVLRGYEAPLETFTTNVDGTLNLLRAVSELRNDPVVLIVTTDKVYRPSNQSKHVESDALGGLDPYSASKAMADLLAQSWSKVHPELRLGIARAGNVIGSFDHARDRLIPDINRARRLGLTLQVRYPDAVRPWQHVLDCLAGYLRYIEILETDADAPIALNIGPDPSEMKRVQDVLDQAKVIDDGLNYSLVPAVLDENPTLTLNNTLAKTTLGWCNLIPFREAVSMSLEEGVSEQKTEEVVDHQIRTYFSKLISLKAGS